MDPADDVPPGARRGDLRQLNNLAMASYRLRGFDRAETLFLESLAMNRTLVGDDPP